MKEEFKEVSANIFNEKYGNMIKRENKLYDDSTSLRSEFERDYTRILYSTAYRRLRHKTQVFFSPENDHICTRIEHVAYVESISYTIAKYLGLNTELTKAIATGHDLGHSPFGHQGEKILSKISERDLGKKFWHEQNGLNLVENIELLEDREQNEQNMNLTYAVRDGIISHCGEVDQNSIRPREEYIDLKDYTRPNEYSPYTWEGCVVKIADKISYIGRDIEDAIKLEIIDKNNLDELYNILNLSKEEKINNNLIINMLVSDLCKNSSLENGLCFSNDAVGMMDKIKLFNYKNIYYNERMKPANRYFELVINELYNKLYELYDGNNTLEKLQEARKIYPKFVGVFTKWVQKYWNFNERARSTLNLKNKIIFDINKKEDYCSAIIYYISGMTDKFAMDAYEEIIRF